VTFARLRERGAAAGTAPPAPEQAFPAAGDRLEPADAAFLYLEDAATPRHVGGVAVLQPPDVGFDHDRLVALVETRLALVPRYRQKVREVPGRLGAPVWVDDPRFDISYHVRRSALPRPGSHDQLRELVARVQSRPLDRGRPLWEMYLVEGLARGRVAIISKSHPALVDGMSAVDLTSVLLDPTPHPRQPPPSQWQPTAGPSSARLVAGAVTDWVRRPAAVLDVARGQLSVGGAGVRRLAGGAATVASGLLAVARTSARPAPPGPLNPTIGAQRRYALVRTDLADYRAVRAAHGGSVNDVVLAVVTGALRSWLLSRGEPVRPTSSVRALVPVSVRPPAAGEPGHRVSSYLVDLPLGEPSAALRLQHVRYAMREHRESQQAVGARALAGLAGFAPPTLHAMGSRIGSGLSRRRYNLAVTNVPGPQFALYAAGARMVEVYPVVPLARGQALSVGATSYDRKVFYGLLGDRDALPDLDVIAQSMEEALAELVGGR
jgi:diacylglycerol O-acyltransferase